MIEKSPRFYIVSSIIVFILIVIVLSIFSIQDTMFIDKKKVEVLVAPSDSIITVDDKVVKGGYISLKPGSYKYTVTREHFEEKTGALIIKDNETAPTLIALLSPLDNEGKVIYNSLQQEYSQIEGKAGQKANEDGEEFRSNNPIINSLPYSNPLFKIGYKIDSSYTTGKSIIITIHSSPVYYANALQQIRNLGYDPVDFNIEIIDEVNPFYE